MTELDKSSAIAQNAHNRAQTKITVDDPQVMVSLLGAADEILKLVERSLTSDILVRGNEITITGAPAENALAERLFAELLELIEKGETLTADSVRRTVGMLEANTSERPAEVLTLNILSRRGRNIRPKTLGQRKYVDAIDGHTIVFSIGPAGTGKTYLAMAKAVQALQAKQVTRIILTRPAVEAGERLGYLPGTLYEKIDPYLRPLYDALHDMIDPDSIPRLMQSGTIEVAPLAYMRGRAQPVFTKVLTPAGFRPIGELRVGDLVVGSNGEPTPVLGVYPQGPKEIYRVFTQDGASTLASADHLWAVATRDDRRRGKPLRVLETKEMIGQKLRAGHFGDACEPKREHEHRYELPLLSQPVEFEPRDVPIDPYALGLLLGDGCMTGKTTPTFAAGDPELALRLDGALIGAGTRVRAKAGVDDVLNEVAAVSRAPAEVTTLENPVTGALRELGLWGTRSETKFVPEPYLHNAAEVRLAVLQGLLDADGGPVTQRDRTCRVQYTTNSPRLRDDVLFLVRSLGGVAYWSARQDAFILDIRLPAEVQPFRLGRKADAYRASGGGRPMRYIHRIEPAGTEEAVCIQVAAADSLYVTEDFLLTHNTLNDAFIILDEAQNTTPEQMKMFLTRLGFGSKIVVTGDVTQVDLPGPASQSGLRVVRDILDEVEDVHFCQLGSADVVRHQLVSNIVDAYAKWDASQEAPGVHAVPGRTGQGGRAGRRR
jgi:phosphate starvation-inducible PhoH-like protein